MRPHPEQQYSLELQKETESNISNRAEEDSAMEEIEVLLSDPKLVTEKDSSLANKSVESTGGGDRLGYIGSSYDSVRQQCCQVMK